MQKKKESSIQGVYAYIFLKTTKSISTFYQLSFMKFFMGAIDVP